MTDAEMRRIIRQFERAIKSRAIDEVRKQFREESGVIVVREYTVKAYLRQYKPKKKHRHLKLVA